MSNTEQCPICEEGLVVEVQEFNEVEYCGSKGSVAMLFSRCNVCDCETANAKHTRENKRAMQAFKKQVDGLLTGSEVRNTREYLGITQAQAANIFGGGKVAFSKYEADDVNQSDAMDKLIRVAKAVPTAFKWLAKNAGEDAIAEKALQRMFVKTETKTAEIKHSYLELKQTSRHIQSRTTEALTFRPSSKFAEISTERLAG